MSVFKVNLRRPFGRTGTGTLDFSLVGGYSIQRSVSVTGPNGVMRELNDGDTFTDSNYYKIYTPEFMGTEAFLDLVTDDGSVYIKESQETIIPRSYALDVDANSVYADNVVDIYADNLGFAVYCQITVVGEGTAPTFKFNGLSNALLSIPCGVTQTFDKNEIQFSKIEIDNSQDGSQALTVSIFSSIQKSSNT